MDKPKIAEKSPVLVDVKEGETYYWCSCGRSSNQPFCNGSHKGTKFEPLAFTPDKDKSVYLCQCKYTKNPPYCDGSHAKL